MFPFNFDLQVLSFELQHISFTIPPCLKDFLPSQNL